ASKFSPPGSCIDISFAVEDGYVWVMVKDSGIGIAEDKQARIFEKFYRVDGSDTAPRGLGLGLYLVQNLVTAHGGQLRLESRPGRGSTFAFSLALTQEESG
ncbi:MAG: sensor histidine kinase, partial [Desulfuromonadaceae bacterium]